MAYTAAQWRAACHIQRIFRGAHLRSNEIANLRKYQQSNIIRRRFTQQSSHYYNTLDPVWATPVKGNKTAKVSFFPVRLVRFENDDVELEEFKIVDGRDTTSGVFASIINASVKKEPIHRFITPDNAPALKEHFEKAIADISSGKSVRVWDGQSTQIHPPSRAILDKAYDGFLYFAGYPPVPGRTEYMEELDAIQELEERLRKLQGEIYRNTIQGIINNPLAPGLPRQGLPRQGPTRIGGVAVDLKKSRSKDDLEERFQKLLALGK